MSNRPLFDFILHRLVREHADRSQWLARRLAASAARPPTDWDDVYAAIAHVNALQA